MKVAAPRKAHRRRPVGHSLPCHDYWSHRRRARRHPHGEGVRRGISATWRPGRTGAGPLNYAHVLSPHLSEMGGAGISAVCVASGYVASGYGILSTITPCGCTPGLHFFYPFGVSL
jgi:hypothetical protein